MRVITWNIHGANKENLIWRILLELKPDLILLQEVGQIPEAISDIFNVLSKIAITKTGKPQKFSTAVLVRGEIINEISLKSEYDWVNRELEYFKGNFISCNVRIQNQELTKVVSVYSPAWPINKERLKGIDVSHVKLTKNPKVWATEIIWSALKNTISIGEQWVVGGDYNSSETFDKDYKLNHNIKGGLASTGNKEILDRMAGLGFSECLRDFNGKIIPTFRTFKDGNIIHQLDHLFVTKDLYSRLRNCATGDQSVIFGESLSDHLPIIADFNDKRTSLC